MIRKISYIIFFNPPCSWNYWIFSFAQQVKGVVMMQIHLDIGRIYFGCTNKYKTQIHSSWGGTCLLTNFQKVFRKHLNIHLTQTLLPLINFQSHYLLKPNSAHYAFHSLYWMCCRWNKCLRKRRCFPFCGGFMKMPKFSCFFSWPAEFKYEPSIFLFSAIIKCP